MSLKLKNMYFSLNKYLKINGVPLYNKTITARLPTDNQRALDHMDSSRQASGCFGST